MISLRIEPISLGISEEKEEPLTGLVSQVLFQELLDAPVSLGLTSRFV